MDLSQFTTTQLVIMMAVGLAALLAGYKIKKIAFFIVWFIIGLNLTHFLMPWFNSTVPQIADSALWQNLLPIAGGILVAFMGFSIEKICVAGTAFALVLIITAQYFGTEIPCMVIGGIIGVVAAGTAVMLMKPATIVVTAIAGAYVLTLGVLYWAKSLSPEAYFFPLLAGIAALGMMVQFLTTKRDL